MTKFKNSILTKLKKLNCDNSKTQIVMVVIVTVVTVVVRVTSFSKNNLTPRQPMRYSQGSFSQFLRCFFLCLPNTKSQTVKAQIVNSLPSSSLRNPHVLIPPPPAETARPARLPGARGGLPGEGAHCLLEGGDPYLGAGQVHISEIVIISSLHVTLFTNRLSSSCS